MRICLVGPLHVSFNPRLVREADTLTEAGHDVRVVSRQSDLALRQLDRDVMERRRWRLQSLDLCRNGELNSRWVTTALRASIYGKAFSIGLRTGSVASRAYVRGFAELQRLAETEPSDWVIAHTLPGLPIAAAAAASLNANLGFDCEDLLAEPGTDFHQIARRIQEKYLPMCDYVSVPSDQIAQRLTEQHAIIPPMVLYNVFPKRLAEGMAEPSLRRANKKLRFHWFSQTIGEGRGLEEAIKALSLLDNESELNLRGRVAEKYQNALTTLSQGLGNKVDLLFHPCISPDAIIQAMEDFDVGLALERPTNSNSARTMSNKLGSYMLAGLAIAASDTPGQREVMNQAPEAGFLYKAGNPEELATKLQAWCDDRDLLLKAKQAAWEIGRNRFCWDIEKEKLLSVLAVGKGIRFNQ
jgi:glycosyltransferase involved in cell wall biosynthesis